MYLIACITVFLHTGFINIAVEKHMRTCPDICFPKQIYLWGPGGLVSEFLVSPRIGNAGTTAARRGTHRGPAAGPPRGPPRGKCPAPGSQDSPDRAKGPSPESQKTDPLPPLKLGKWTPSGPKPRKRKNEKAIFGGIGELGLSGWRGSIRLVKLVWLVLPKKKYWAKRPKIPKEIKKD